MVGRQQRKVLGNPKTRESLLKALEETGNISESCRRVEISTPTYYRYLKTDPEFKQRAQRVLEVGRKKKSKLANPKKQEELLEALEETGNITESCRRVEVSN